MKILYEMIHNRALKDWCGDKVTKENHLLWAEHWFKHAGQLRDNFAEQGLPESSKEVDRIINEQMQFYPWMKEANEQAIY